MSGKLRATEHRRRLFQFAIALQGANGARWVGDSHAADRGLWQETLATIKNWFFTYADGDIDYCDLYGEDGEADI